MFDIHKELEKVHLSRPGMPLVMGILNVTPDSFSDGGLFVSQDVIEKRVMSMLEDGVDILDVGGESTRPGADTVSLQQELDRVLPVIEWVKARFDVPISIDTYKTHVMSESIKAGAQIVNDVNALQAVGAVESVAETGVTVCLMHKKGNPVDMQVSPSYDDVLEEVSRFLLDRVAICEKAGISKNKIIIDPGFGFGKNLTHNTALFKNLSKFTSLSYPVLVGVSRKRMIGELLNDALLDKRMIGSISAAVVAGLKGAAVVRVHDVGSTVEALNVAAHLA